MKQPLTCVLTLNDGSTVFQSFHPNYCDKNGSVEEAYQKFAAETCEQIKSTRVCLMKDEDIIRGTDDKVIKKQLEATSILKKARLSKMRAVLLALTDGKFSFSCQDTSCPHRSSCENTDLTKAKFVMPEVTNCARRRSENEMSGKQVRRAAF